LCLPDRQGGAYAVCDQGALFLGQGRVDVQHERVGIGAKLRMYISALSSFG
jgi:hypothetical protein